MKNTKVSKVMLSTLVTGGLVFISLVSYVTCNEIEAPNITKGETQIELPSSALVPTFKSPEQSAKEIKAEGEKLQYEREERVRIEHEKARLAEEARLSKIEAERKAKEEAERKAREEAECKRQSMLQQQKEIARQKQLEYQKQQTNAQPQKQALATNGVAFNGSYYTPYCNGCSGVTATGYDVRSSIYVDGMRVIAVDPRVIPLYSIVEVSTPYEKFRAIALDTGGAIKGHKVDILVADKQTAYNLGRHTVYVKVIRNGK